MDSEPYWSETFLHRTHEKLDFAYFAEEDKRLRQSYVRRSVDQLLKGVQLVDLESL